jgi:hypothetical protein
MSEQWQIRRGNTADNDAFTGAQGEITMDTTTKQLRVHDGETQGGAGVIDPVVAFQAPTADNNYTWYRKYRSGWVEMGGKAVTDGANPTPITLPVEVADTNYIPFIQGRTATDGYSNAQWQVMPVNTATSPQTTTGFYAQASITGYNLTFGWQVCYMAA